MSRILSLNLDFVLILQGGLLLFLAIVVWGLGRRDSQPPWFWFAGYALLQSLRTALELVAFEQSAPPLYDLFKDVLLVGTSLVLIEFARTKPCLKNRKELASVRRELTTRGFTD